MDKLPDWFAVAVAAWAIVVSYRSWFRTQALQKRQAHTGSMIEYQRMLLEINGVMLQYPQAAAAFEMGNEKSGYLSEAVRLPAFEQLTPEERFRVRVITLYHIDLLELVHEYYRNATEMSDLDAQVRKSWREWERWLIRHNTHVRSFVQSGEFEDCYNESFVEAARRHLLPPGHPALGGVRHDQAAGAPA